MKVTVAQTKTCPSAVNTLDWAQN